MTFLSVRSLPMVVSIIFTTTSVSVFSETGNPRVNQHGYLPNGPKVATYANSSNNAQAWKLLRDGKVVSSGTTTVFGNDEASGDFVHQIDFTSVESEGENYEIQVGSDTSYAFKIDALAYTAPTYDALRYFYHNRSGIEIKTQYTGGGHGSYLADSKWARPAGHLNVAPNKGDSNVACWPGTCDYSLDVTKGWYDAGDHGKYVVNGGISVWKLLNTYERAIHLGSNSNAFADGMLNIPESGNGVPDLLDEARWQLEFLMAMQVPDGKNLAGMVHHKIHDDGWTGFPLAPHEDNKTRYLVPPTTAATLNVAAVAAQCARIWSDIDATFANKCLTVAEKAWNAAQANPSMIYGENYNNGGGGYGDNTVADEFIWAAAELLITTGESKYATAINTILYSSEWSWANTQAAALLSLATVSTPSTSALQEQARATIKTLADELVGISNREGYEVPIGKSNIYWGSNNTLANKMILIASAYDYTQDDKYLKVFGKAMDYLFGRNALSKSYITGYGEDAAEQPHHRFWSGAKDSRYPWAPAGSLVGGPNGNKHLDAMPNCNAKPQTCYVDDIDIYEVNEITINWNSALVWITAFYDDFATAVKTPNARPIAMLTVSSTEGEAPLTIAFDATGTTDADGDGLTYDWSFGDSNSASGLITNHTYTEAGNYTAVLTVNDGHGQGITKNVAITVTQAADVDNGSGSDSNTGGSDNSDSSADNGSGSDANTGASDNSTADSSDDSGSDVNADDNGSNSNAAGSLGGVGLWLLSGLLFLRRKVNN